MLSSNFKVPFDLQEFQRLVNGNKLSRIAHKYLDFEFRNDVEDVVQTSLVEVWRQREAIRTTTTGFTVQVLKTTAVAWRGRVVHSNAHRKEKQPIVGCINGIDIQDSTSGVLEELCQRECTIEALEKLVGRLPRREQELYYAFKANGFTPGRDNHTMGCKVTKLKKWLKEEAAR